jgi:Zeta toxin
MVTKSSRPLNNFELVEHFLENALSLELNDNDIFNTVPKIVSTELNIDNFDESLISKGSKAFRVAKYRNDTDRKKLLEEIVLDLLSKKRVENDEDITLNIGGAFPLTEVQTSRDAYIIIGLPASGKSGISNRVADSYGALILDSDYAKRKLPEFKALPFGATLVHEESDKIIFGDNISKKFKSLLDYCSELGMNIVIPKIGHSYEGILDLVKTLKINQYKVHLTLVELDRVKATQRALERFKQTERYVPLGLIFDNYSNNPTITFYKILTHNSETIESYGVINTDVKIGQNPIVIIKEAKNPSNLY